jgi:membrane-bound ClpP family serine protease
MKERSRIMLTILATLLEEIALVIFVLLGLPMLGVEVPLPALIAMMAGIAAYGVISYRMGRRTLLKKPVSGLSDMVGIRGKVITTLDPKGTIKIGSEIWSAKSAGSDIDKGSVVVVIKQKGLQLIVRSIYDESEDNPEL